MGLGFLLLSPLSLNTRHSWGAMRRWSWLLLPTTPSEAATTDAPGTASALGSSAFVTYEPGAVLCIPQCHLLPLFKLHPELPSLGSNSWGAQELNLHTHTHWAVLQQGPTLPLTGATGGLEWISVALTHGHLSFPDCGHNAEHCSCSPSSEGPRTGIKYPLLCIILRAGSYL